MDPPGDATVAVVHTSGTTGAPKPVLPAPGADGEARACDRPDRSSSAPDRGTRPRRRSTTRRASACSSSRWRAGPRSCRFRTSRPDTWRALEPLAVTHATVVPALIEAALTADVLGLPTLEWIQYGSSPLHPDTARRLLDGVPEHPVGATARSDRRLADHHPVPRGPRRGARARPAPAAFGRASGRGNGATDRERRRTG